LAPEAYRGPKKARWGGLGRCTILNTFADPWGIRDRADRHRRGSNKKAGTIKKYGGKRAKTKKTARQTSEFIGDFCSWGGGGRGKRGRDKPKIRTGPEQGKKSGRTIPQSLRKESGGGRSRKPKRLWIRKFFSEAKKKLTAEEKPPTWLGATNKTGRHRVFSATFAITKWKPDEWKKNKRVNAIKSGRSEN